MCESQLPKVEDAERPKNEAEYPGLHKVQFLGTFGQECILGSSKAGESSHHKAGGSALYTELEKVGHHQLKCTWLSQKLQICPVSVKKESGGQWLAHHTWLTILMTLLVPLGLGCVPGSPDGQNGSCNQDGCSHVGSLQLF